MPGCKGTRFTWRERPGHVPIAAVPQRQPAIDVSIFVHSTGPVWRPAARGPHGTHTLDEAIGRSIIDRVSVLPRHRRVRLRIALPADELAESADAPAAIGTAIRADFARRRETAEHDLLRTRRSGLVSLLVATAMLVSLMSLVEAIRGLAPPGRLATMLEEGLTIVAWVALWRPAELLLYDQWPIRSDIALLRRVEAAAVDVVAAEPTTRWAGAVRRVSSHPTAHPVQLHPADRRQDAAAPDSLDL